MNPFVEASLVLERRGWMQNPRPNSEKICIGMAIETVVPVGTILDDGGVYAFLRNYTRERYNRSVIDANDFLIDSQEEAVGVLRECARRWETSGGSTAREETAQ